jgi:hypothetical protein
MIFINNQLDAQLFFVYVYFYSLHVSGSHVPIIRRIIVSMRHLVYVTLCRWSSGMQVRMTHKSIKTKNIKTQFLYDYFYSLHVSGSHVPIISRIIVAMRHLVYITLCRWSSGREVRMEHKNIKKHNLYMFISILYMFRAAMCPSSGELLYQCDAWFMSISVDDSLVCRLTCIPDGQQNLKLLKSLNPLNAKFNPICHLLALLGPHHILHVSTVRFKQIYPLKCIASTPHKT